MMLSMVFFFAGGTVVLEFGNGTGLAGEMAHFDGEIFYLTGEKGALRRGKRGI
jgi:hypothetical protein